MADWNYPALPTVDAPVTAEWGATVQENPVALAEGAAGAPRISGLAMKGAANGSVVVFRSRRPGMEAPLDSLHMEVLGFTAIAAGSGTLRLEVRGDTVAGVSVNSRFFVGNTQVYSEAVSAGAWTTVSFSATWAAGDYVSITVDGSSVSSQSAHRNPLVLAAERVVLGA